MKQKQEVMRKEGKLHNIEKSDSLRKRYSPTPATQPYRRSKKLIAELQEIQKQEQQNASTEWIYNLVHKREKKATFF